MKNIKTIVLITFFLTTSVRGFSQSLTCDKLVPENTDPKLNIELATYFKKMWEKNIALDFSGSVQGTYLRHVYSNSTKVVRDNSNTITGMNMYVYVLIKHKSGKCKVIQVTLLRSYLGGGTYDTQYKPWVSGDTYKVDCACADNIKDWLAEDTKASEVKAEPEKTTSQTQNTDVKSSTITQGKDAASLPKLDKSKPGYKAEKSGNIIIWEGYKKGGEVEGESRMYNDAGKIESLQHNVKGLREGYSAEYYENGKIKTEGNYKKDKQDGEWKRYSENGKLAGVDIYIDGEKQ